MRQEFRSVGADYFDEWIPMAPWGISEEEEEGIYAIWSYKKWFYK